MGTVSVLITPGKKFFFLHSPFEPQEWNLAWTVCKRVFVARTWHMSLMMLAGPGHTKAAFRSESVLRDVHRREKFTLQCMVWSKGPRIRKIINHLLRCQNILNQLGAGMLGPMLCNHCRHLSPVQEKKGSECCQSWGFLTCPFCIILWEGKWAHVAGKAPVPALRTSPARCSASPGEFSSVMLTSKEHTEVHSWIRVNICEKISVIRIYGKCENYSAIRDCLSLIS